MILSKTMGVDIETYSEADIAKTGLHRYATDPSFEILLIGYKLPGMTSPEVIDISGMPRGEAVDFVKNEYPDFYEALKSPDCRKTAFNAAFERNCLSQYFDEMPPEQWQCTMIRAAQLGLPMSLASVGEALGLKEDQAKLKSGKALIQYFCKPCKPTKVNGGRTRNLPHHAPDRWDLFIEYNRQDVVAEQAIIDILDQYGPMDPNEQRLWEWDQRLNDRGVMLDIPYIKNILNYDNRRRAELEEEAKKITGLANPNSVMQLKGWLEEKGVYMDGVTKETVAKALKEDLPKDAKRVLEIRQALGKTSCKKYEAMLNAVCADSRLRGILQFYGANRTGRWAGRIVQTHNLPQNHIDDLDYCRELTSEGDFEAVEMIWGETAFIFSQLVRTAFIAPEGQHFVVCDFSAVEARIIAALAHVEWRMKVFAEGGDIYCASASQMFHVPVVKHGINGHLRARGKVAELALGYQGNVGALKRMDSSGAIPEDEMPGIVKRWREASPEIPKLWRKMELAAKTAIATRRGESDPVEVQGGIKFFMKKNVLFMRLPSGRKLAYWNAKLMQMDDGAEHITYSGINQETKKWEITETYGGKLTENAVQAIGRDGLAEAMLRVTDMGYKIVMHVHDEMIVEVDDTDTEAYKKIAAAMGVSPTWMPDLLLRGDGYETKFYKKD